MKKTILSIALMICQSSLLTYGQNTEQKNDAPEFMGIKSNSYITRQQAISDIDQLVYTLSEVHPNIYANCTMASFHDRINRAKAIMPDSVDSFTFFRMMAPIVASIKDPHTNILEPLGRHMVPNDAILPVLVTINDKGRMIAEATVDSLIPDGAEITGINGVSAKEIVSTLASTMGGDRDFLIYTWLSNSFPQLFKLYYNESIYNVKYTKGKANGEAVLKAVSLRHYSQYFTEKKSKEIVEQTDPYSFRILEGDSIAVMDFNSCADSPDRMGEFADSMISVLKSKGINNLIIDVSQNGGGNSRVGSELLLRILDKPFRNSDKVLYRVTPVTKALDSSLADAPGIWCYDCTGYNVKPLPAEKRFNGKVYLIVGHNTFSSAGLFANSFKQSGRGMVIGQESGGMSVHFGDTKTFALTNSQLTVKVSHKRFWEWGADENNIHGTLPDVRVPVRNALDETIRIIHGSGKPAQKNVTTSQKQETKRQTTSQQTTSQKISTNHRLRTIELKRKAGKKLTEEERAYARKHGL